MHALLYSILTCNVCITISFIFQLAALALAPLALSAAIDSADYECHVIYSLDKEHLSYDHVMVEAEPYGPLASGQNTL